MRSKASDIHIEPFEHRVCVRYRIDGALQKQFDSPKEPLAGLITRIKIMSNMDIAERRVPQDGRIFTRVDNENVDLRVSVLPTVNGEKIVIRILDKSAFNVDKSVLGIADDDLDKINKIISKPHGIVLVTGPTGSGKSTTLYSLLKDLNKQKRVIFSYLKSCKDEPIKKMAKLAGRLEKEFGNIDEMNTFSSHPAFIIPQYMV